MKTAKQMFNQTIILVNKYTQNIHILLAMKTARQLMLKLKKNLPDQDVSQILNSVLPFHNTSARAGRV